MKLGPNVWRYVASGALEHPCDQEVGFGAGEELHHLVAVESFVSNEHRSYCSGETWKATQKEEDGGAVVTKHTS